MSTFTDGTAPSVTPGPDDGPGTGEDARVAAERGGTDRADTGRGDTDGADTRRGDAHRRGETGHGETGRSETEATATTTPGSIWLHEEIQRRIATGNTGTLGRHSRRDPGVSSGSTSYVPRHSVPPATAPQAPQPGARRPDGPSGPGARPWPVGRPTADPGASPNRQVGPAVSGPGLPSRPPPRNDWPRNLRAVQDPPTNAFPTVPTRAQPTPSAPSAPPQDTPPAAAPTAQVPPTATSKPRASTPQPPAARSSTARTPTARTPTSTPQSPAPQSRIQSPPPSELPSRSPLRGRRNRPPLAWDELIGRKGLPPRNATDVDQAPAQDAVGAGAETAAVDEQPVALAGTDQEERTAQAGPDPADPNRARPVRLRKDGSPKGGPRAGGPRKSGPRKSGPRTPGSDAGGAGSGGPTETVATPAETTAGSGPRDATVSVIPAELPTHRGPSSVSGFAPAARPPVSPADPPPTDGPPSARPPNRAAAVSAPPAPTPNKPQPARRGAAAGSGSAASGAAAVASARPTTVVPVQRTSDELLLAAAAAAAAPANDLQNKRVRVVLAERKGVARPVRTVVDIQEGTGVGELLRSNLIGSQLAVALRFAVGAGLTLGLLPLLFAMFPEIGLIDVFGLRLPWLLLGFLVYPFLLGLGWWHTRTAERVEQNFADHVQD